MKVFDAIKSLVLTNSTVKQTILKNTFWIAFAMGVSKLLKLGLIIYVARVLGVVEFGKFNFALAFISLFVVFHNFGVPVIVTREFARKGEDSKEFYSILSLKILLGFVTTTLVVICSFFITGDVETRKVIFVLAFFALLSNLSLIFYSFFKARQKMEYEAMGTIIEAIVVTVAGFFVIFYLPSILNLSYGYLFSAFFGLVATATLFHFKFLPLKISFDVTIWKKFFVLAFPLAMTSFFAMIYGYIDSVIMGSLGKIAETGFYNAAYKIVLVLMMPAGIITAGFYPALSKFFKLSQEKFKKTFEYYIQTMVLIAIPLVCGGIILAPKIILSIYGSDFTPSVFAFQILVVMAGIFFFYKPFMQILIASNQQKRTLWISIAGSAVNIILNLFLIPLFSLYGAAFAAVCTYAFVSILLYISILKFTPVSGFGRDMFLVFFVAMFSSLVMSFVISRDMFDNLNVIFIAAMGIGTYFFMLLAFKPIIMPVFLKK